VLGVARIEYLGYEDSGMMGEPGNKAPESFWQADVEEAARRLAAILEEERADLLTVYDANGNYGHPDHIQVNRVGVRAAELAGVAEVYEATVNRDEIDQFIADAEAIGVDLGPIETSGAVPPDLGVPGAELTTRVDVEAFLDVKRASMRAHASQISETSFFLALSDEAFRRAFGTEWFIHRGVPRPVDELETELLP
jgi:LmbE family N-acetylglucosaminyl deacetylase